MSTHLLIAASYLEDLPPSTKLVLMAVADSGDEHTLESAPGLPKLRAWSGLGKRQALNVVRQLEAAGYLEQTVAAARGRRAVWRVFPAGVPAIPHPSEVAARFADETVHNGENAAELVDNPEIMGATGSTQSAVMGAKSDVMGATGSTPSVLSFSPSTRDAGNNTHPRRVDKPTPSASNGFPGARPKSSNRAREDGAPEPFISDPGAPCPIHPDQFHPCPACARVAVPAEAAADTISEARRLIAAAKHTATTAPEERPA